MTVRLGIKGTVAAVTINWLVTIPAVLFFFTQVVRWPWDFTLLMAGPFFVLFVPGGYALAIAAAKHETRGLRWLLSPSFVARCFVLSLPFTFFYLCLVWVYGMMSTRAYTWMVVAGLFAVLSAWGILVAFRNLVAEVRGGGEPPPDQGGGRD